MKDVGRDRLLDEVQICEGVCCLSVDGSLSVFYISLDIFFDTI